MNLFFVSLLAILAGATISFQAGINSQLQLHWAQSPILAACVSFTVGTIFLIACVLVLRIPVPPLPSTFTPWHWTGGLLGAFLVTVTAYSAPRLGAAPLIALVLAGQISAGLLLDHFGLAGYAQKSITWQKIAGVGLLGAGVFLIKRF